MITLGNVTELTLLPAVDVREGRAVQLQQGVAGSERVFGDPLEVARRWRDLGAEWIHLVDLDAAFGHGTNQEVIRSVVGEMGINVEVSGGIRDQASLDAALAAGATRVNIGTAALENPTWCDEVVGEYGERVAIGLDVRGDRLAARGWTREGGPLLDVLARLEEAGCKRYVVTDVASDGMLTGPNYELLGRVCARTQGTVVASGGISNLEDLRRLRGLVPIGVEGAIVGTALYVGNFTLPEALRVCREPIPADGGTAPTEDHSDPAGV